MIGKDELDYWDEIAVEFCYKIISRLIENFLKFKISPDSVSILARSLKILEAYPKQVTNGYISISSSSSHSGGSSYFELEIAGEYLEIKKGGSVYDPEVGSDSFSEILFNSSSASFNETELFTVTFDEYQESLFELIDKDGSNLHIYDETYPYEPIIDDKSKDEVALDEADEDFFSPPQPET